MKRLFTILVFTVTTLFLSCNRNEFDYPMDTIYGTWEGIELGVDGNWIDLTDSFFSEFRFSITFYEDGTYYGRGYFGTGSGTYRAKDDIIYTYVDDKPYRNYRVLSLNNNRAELEMFVDGAEGTINLKVEKQ